MCDSVHVFAFVLLAWLALAQGQDVAESREVTIAQGIVRGYKSNDFDVFEYYNIPYAAAPLGVDRFKAPLPAPSWNETFDAVYRGITCPQPNGFIHGQVTEDCLVANVYTPDTEQRDLPVLVIVHGGGYLVGVGSNKRPRGFVDSQKVIVVTFNYRLSVHGFLCLGTEEAPGNAGMKDQVALLRWVRDNIASFGGNPKDVTISGCSAGGSSVDTLLLSKLTEGLFNKVIADSGCSIAPFNVQLDPLQNAKDHLFRLNFTNVDVENITALGEFYTTTPLEVLNEYDTNMTPNSYFVFQLCVERDIGQEMFLDDAPMSILKSGNFSKLPILYGYAHHEGMMALIWFDVWKTQMNEKFSDFLPDDLEFESDEQKEETAEAVKRFYFKNETVNENTIMDYLNYFSDSSFISSILRTVTLQVLANNTEVYLYDYLFTHSGSMPIPHANKTGANHCDQVLAIMDVPIEDPEFIEMSRIMRQMFRDFIYTGNPTPPESNANVTWLPTGEDRSPHLAVGSSFQLLGVPSERALFWDEIYENHYRTPLPPNITDPEPDPNAAASHLLSKQYWIMIVMGVLTILYEHYL